MMSGDGFPVNSYTSLLVISFLSMAVDIDRDCSILTTLLISPSHSSNMAVMASCDIPTPYLSQISSILGLTA